MCKNFCIVNQFSFSGELIFYYLSNSLSLFFFISFPGTPVSFLYFSIFLYILSFSGLIYLLACFINSSCRGIYWFVFSLSFIFSCNSWSILYISSSFSFISFCIACIFICICSCCFSISSISSICLSCLFIMFSIFFLVFFYIFV